MNGVLGHHQTAHLTNSNIHVTIMKIQSYAMQLSKGESLLALDFSKVFDCVNRDFLIGLVNKLPFTEFVKDMIGIMYEKTFAFITIETTLSEGFETTRGVRQGCPLSALLFNLAIEPLLQRIQRCKRIKSKQTSKCVAYADADDVSVCMLSSSIKKSFLFLNHSVKYPH